MAQSLHKTADAEKYLGRSKNWKNMWNPNQNSYIYVNQSDGSTGYVDSGFYGFLQPRYLNGTFGYQDAMLCSPMYQPSACYLVPTGHEVRFLLHLPVDTSLEAEKLVTESGTNGYLTLLSTSSYLLTNSSSF